MTMNSETVKKAVRDTYSKIGDKALQDAGCCVGSCCGTGGESLSPDKISAKLGYTDTDVSEVPMGANLGLGCGNPQAIAGLNAGETVIDLGSG